MPDLKIIVREFGKNPVVFETNYNLTVNELINKIFKSKGILSKKEKAKYECIYNCHEIQPSDLQLKSISLKNPAEIVIKERGSKEMEKGKDNWEDGIILGGRSLVFKSAEEEIFVKKNLKEKVAKKIKNMIYCASLDGDKANDFHKKCDNKGPLLYMIRTKDDKVFGVYVSKPICSDGVTRNDSTQMVICPYKNFAILSLNGNSTYHCNPNSGALFHCMQINTPFLSSTCVDISSCDNFTLPSYPSGNYNYQIKELEVYSLEDSN